MRNALQRVRLAAFAYLLATCLSSTIATIRPGYVSARALPPHCDELAHGECDDVWFCLIACFMELAGRDDYCSQHPNSPQCL